jgi:hypothetical protein
LGNHFGSARAIKTNGAAIKKVLIATVCIMCAMVAMQIFKR